MFDIQAAKAQALSRAALVRSYGEDEHDEIAELAVAALEALEGAQGKLEAVRELPLHHERKPAGFVEEGEHLCYDHCLACQRDAILRSKEEE